MSQTYTARYPSNIALIKYWGKYGNQRPCNASLSMTLQHAYTEVRLQCLPKKQHGIELAYFFDGEPKDSFRERIAAYIGQQAEFTELTNRFSLRIDSHNSFPHSAGIASSASAFAAIAAALLAATGDISDFARKGSRLARLGSGSACRSFYGPFALWGKLEGIQGSSDEYAVELNEIHTNFSSMRDAILIVEDRPKKVSSSAGHALMQDHPFAEARFRQANQHCQAMTEVLKQGDWERFIAITEREALTLHAMMMTSKAYYLLMKPGTVELIQLIFRFREETGLPVCFTLDAGPNIHLLYPDNIQEEVHTFVEQNLSGIVKSVIYDQSGKGGTLSEDC